MSFQPTDEQLAAINTLDRNSIVTAGAGSGKTFVLVERFFRIIEKEAQADENIVAKIVAITFTDKAANEMQDRVRAKVVERRQAAIAVNNEKDIKLWSNIILQLENSNIATFHAYSAKLLRLYPIEAGLDPSFDVMEGTESKRVIKNIVEKILKESLAGDNKLNNPGLFSWLDIVGYKRAVSNLVEIYGKMYNHVTKLDEAIQLTENSFAKGFDEVLTSLPVLIELADNLYYVDGESKKMLEFREFWGARRATIDQRSVNFEVFTAIANGLATKSGGNFYLEAARGPRQVLNNYAKQLVEICNAFENYQEQEQNLTAEIFKLLRTADAAYKVEKALLNKLDFNDIILNLIHLLRNNQWVRAEVRSNISYLMIDEFQDSNQIQKELIDLLLIDDQGEIKPGGLFIVGDPKQSIYRFRGADVTIFKEMERELMRQGGSILPMKINFRSQPEIIDFFNYFFSKIMSIDANSPNFYEEAEYGKKETGLGTVEYIPVHDDKTNSKLGNSEFAAELLAEYKLQEREAILIASRIKELVESGVKPKEITILFQAMTNVRLYEQALRNLDLPFFTVGGRGFFAKQEIYDLLNIINYLDNQSDQIALAGILRSPMVAITDETLYLLAKGNLLGEPVKSWDLKLINLSTDEFSKLDNFIKIFAEWEEDWSGAKLTKQLDFWVNKTNFITILLANQDGIQKLANLNKFRRYVDELIIDNPFSINLLRKRIASIIEDDEKITEAAISSELDNAVRLMNIHQSKGLQFSYVIIANLSRRPISGNLIIRYDLEKGLSCKVPLVNGELGAPLRWIQIDEIEKLLRREEAIRLLYVAATRAINGLIFSGKLEDEINEDDILDSPLWSKWFGSVFDYSKIRGNALPYTTKGRTREIQVFSEEIDLAQLSSDRKELVDITKTITEALKSPQDELVANIDKSFLQAVKAENRNRLFNITAINRYLKCPQYYYYFDVIKINQLFPDLLFRARIDDNYELEEDATGDVHWNKFLTPRLKGIIVHDLLESITLEPSKLAQWEDLFERQVANINYEKDEIINAELAAFKLEVEAFISNYALSPLASSDADEIMVELEFILQLANGKIYGLIDRLELDSDGFTIIDYKTDQVINSEQYMAQIKTYALAMFKNLKKNPKAGWLYFIRYNQLEEIPVDKASLIAWESELEEILIEINQTIDNGHYTKNLKQCSNCEFIKICEEA